MGYYQKYIDSEKLKAEIERLLKCTELHRGEAVADGSRQTLYWIKDFIDSLQQEQSFEDLEVRKQIEELANDWHHKGFASDEDCPLCMQDLIDILWHFYELGQRDAANKFDEIEYNRQRAQEQEGQR